MQHVTTNPKPRRLPSHLAQAIAEFIGPIPHYQPGQRADSCGIGPRYRRDAFGRLDMLNQLHRITATK